MNNTTNVSIRMDKDLKKAADSLYNRMGLTFSAAVMLFVRQSLNEHAIPFKPSVDFAKLSTNDLINTFPAYKLHLEDALTSYNNNSGVFHDLIEEEESE